MKLHTALLLGALLSVPGVALAQDATSPAPVATAAPAQPANVRVMRFHMDPAQMKAHMAKMHAAMKQFEALRRAERASMLGALSSAHRAYLASVIGNLSISAKPDPKAAVAAIDAKLSGSEKTAILAVDKTYRAKTKALMVSLMKDMPRPPGFNPGGPMQRPAMQGGNAMPHSSKHKMHHHTMTAGMLLFAAATGRHREGMGMMGGPMMGGGDFVFIRSTGGSGGSGDQWSGPMHRHGGPGPMVPPAGSAPVVPQPAPTATP